MKVIFAPEVEDDLFQLVEILVRNGYLGTYEFAVSYVEDLIQYIQANIHTTIHKKAPLYFNQFGTDLWYMAYRRSQHTTWYVFFSKVEETYWVKYIANNHIVSQYL